jgi:hypothetical protein
MKTDHRALVWLFGQADAKHSVLQRWILRLNSFDFECIYTPGKRNVVCDALSRYPQLTTKYDLKSEIEPLYAIAEGDSHRIWRDCENKYPLAQHKPIANGKAWEVHSASKRHVIATNMAVTDVILITSTKLTAEEPLVLVQGPAKQLKCETCTTLREKCKYKKCTVLVPIGNGENALRNWKTHIKGKRHAHAVSMQHQCKDKLEERVPEAHALSCMLDEQLLRLENPDREANILLLTMDHVDRVKLFAIGDEEPATNPVQAKEVEPMVLRQKPFVAQPDDIPELAKQAQSPKPRVLKEAQSKLAEAQRADKALRPIFAWVEKRECPLHGKKWKSFENWVKHYLLQDGLLYKSIQIEKDEQPSQY